MAPYSLAGAAPDGDERYMGKSETSYHTKRKKRSIAMKTPKNAGHQQEGEREELLDPVGELPHRENPREEHDPRQGQHGQAEAVDGIEVVNAQGVDPEDLLNELQSPWALS